MNLSTIPKKEIKRKEIPQQPSPIVNHPIEKLWLRIMLSLDLLYVAFKCLGNPINVIKVSRTLKKKYVNVFGEELLNKVSKVDGKYYWKFATPGFPSQASRQSRANEVNRVMPYKSSNGLGILLFGITKKCPLSCEHCYEWDRMHQKEKLSTEDLLQIMHKYQDYGTTQMQFGGGEPLLRIKDIYTMLDHAKEGTDFWIVTSGWKFKAKQATKLKNKGLTGVMISLDHHQPEGHDKFRGKEGSYDMAIEAALHAKHAKLVTGLSLCPTKAYTTEENLRAYIELAKQLGVTFVQIFEPKPAGRYKDKEVLLSKDQEKLLEDLYIEYNQSKKYKDYPIINYTGYHQRRTGCFGGGDYYFYIDTDGDAHKCPLCSVKVCNALAFSADDTVNLLKQTAGCHFFEQCDF